MCTVTIVPTPSPDGESSGVRIACNRDESRGRPPADPPAIRPFGDRQAILPSDPTAGGTWVAVNDAGLYFTLLNRNPRDMRGVSFPGRQSRGAIITSLLDTGALDEAERRVREIDAAGYAPFRLVVTDGVDVLLAAARDDALDVHRAPILDTPRMFTSSGLGDALVEMPRRHLFVQSFDQEPADWIAQQDAFHRHRWAAKPELSVNMARDDALSVSLTLVAIDAGRVSMTYHGAPPDEPAEDVTLGLPRTAAEEAGR